MNIANNDHNDILFSHLDYLHLHAPSVYLNLRRVMDASYRNFLARHAEQCFLASDTEDFDCYGVMVDYEHEVAAYLKMPYCPSAFYYLFVCKDIPYGMLYALDPDNHIAARSHISGERRLMDTLHTFAPYLAACCPGDAVCSVNAKTGAAEIMEGSVPHAV